MKKTKTRKESLRISFSLKDVQFDKKGRVVIANRSLAKYVRTLERKGHTTIEADMYYTDAQCLCMCNCA